MIDPVKVSLGAALKQPGATPFRTTDYPPAERCYQDSSYRTESPREFEQAESLWIERGRVAGKRAAGAATRAIAQAKAQMVSIRP